MMTDRHNKSITNGKEELARVQPKATERVATAEEARERHGSPAPRRR